MINTKPKIAVIGGGISGLCCAYLLNKNGMDAELFEKNSYPGGNIKSENINGFLIEHGPNSTLETSPLLNELFDELGIQSRKIYASGKAKKRYILKNGKLIPLPSSPSTFIRSELFSAKAKLRLLKEPFITTRSNPSESIAEFTERRLGREFLDYAIDPFVSGIFAGDPFNLNVKTAFPKLYELEQAHGSLIKGAIKNRRLKRNNGETSKQSAKSFSFKNGMQELVDALYYKINNIINTETKITELRHSINRRYELTSEKNEKREKRTFDSVIISLPASAAYDLLKTIDAKIAADLESIYSPPVTVVAMAVKNEELRSPLDGFGFLVPEKENRKILGALWNSALFPGRTPDGYSLVTIFVGGSRQPGIALEDDNTLRKIVTGELKSIMRIKGEPGLIKIIRWKTAIPQYRNNHALLTDRLDEFQERNPGIYICSNYYKGISVCDCVKNAYSTAKRILNFQTVQQDPIPVL